MCWWQFQDYNTPKITTMIYVKNVWKCLMTTSKVAPICAAKLQNWLRIASSPWKGVVSMSQNAELPRSKENSDPPKIIKNLDQFHRSLTKNPMENLRCFLILFSNVSNGHVFFSHQIISRSLTSAIGCAAPAAWEATETVRILARVRVFSGRHPSSSP